MPNSDGSTQKLYARGTNSSGMSTRAPVFVAVVVLALAVFVTAASAQEVESDIRFDDEVVVGEETTITYISTVVETPADVEADIEVDLLVDGERVDTFSTQADVFEGAELETDFTHTFESAGEKRVTVEATATVSRFTPDLTETTTANVTVLEAGDNGDVSDAKEEPEADGVETTEDTAGETDGEDETGTGTEAAEGLPGFTTVTVLFSLVLAVSVAVRKEG